jgi:hypothetical protein
MIGYVRKIEKNRIELWFTDDEAMQAAETEVKNWLSANGKAHMCFFALPIDRHGHCFYLNFKPSVVGVYAAQFKTVEITDFNCFSYTRKGFRGKPDVQAVKVYLNKIDCI